MAILIKTNRRRAKGPRIHGVVIGKLVGSTEAGLALVDFARNPAGELLPARSVERWGAADLGRAVVLMFERGRPDRPIIMGFLEPDTGPGPSPAAVKAEVDGERLLLTADREITLRCGEASITLTAAGKVLIQGAYLSSRSTGVNRIKGGSVQIN